jgi:hypothetical protein
MPEVGLVLDFGGPLSMRFDGENPRLATTAKSLRLDQRDGFAAPS